MWKCKVFESKWEGYFCVIVGRNRVFWQCKLCFLLENWNWNFGVRGVGRNRIFWQCKLCFLPENWKEMEMKNKWEICLYLLEIAQQYISNVHFGIQVIFNFQGKFPKSTLRFCHLPSWLFYLKIESDGNGEYLWKWIELVENRAKTTLQLIPKLFMNFHFQGKFSRSTTRFSQLPSRPTYLKIESDGNHKGNPRLLELVENHAKTTPQLIPKSFINFHFQGKFSRSTPRFSHLPSQLPYLKFQKSSPHLHSAQQVGKTHCKPVQKTRQIESLTLIFKVNFHGYKFEKSIFEACRSPLKIENFGIKMQRPWKMKALWVKSKLILNFLRKMKILSEKWGCLAKVHIKFVKKQKR